MKQLLGKAESIWVDTTPKTNYPTLPSDLQTDVCVVGAGIAGLTAAYLLSKAGKKVVLIEALKIAGGTSGYTTAKITSLHGLIYDFLITHFGREKAKIYGDSNEWAVGEYVRIIEEEKIECNLTRADAYTYTSGNTNDIHKEFEAAKKLNLLVSYEEDVQLPFITFKAGVKFANQAHFHPRKYLLSLAEIIIKHNGQIFENTRALDIQENGKIKVICNHGTVTASDVVMATNYPFYDKNFFFLKMQQSRSYAYAIEPKISDFEAMILGMGKDEPSVRPFKERDKSWLIVGGGERILGVSEDVNQQFFKLQELVEKLFEKPVFGYRWMAQDSTPIDRLPYIGRLHSKSGHLYVTTGFDKWGMTKSLVSARLLTDLILGNKNPWAELYDPGRLNLTASVGKFFSFGENVVRGFGAKLFGGESDDLGSLPKNQGKIIKRNGEQIAVYKDEKGEIQAVSAVCTHMGCIVGWNNEAKTWDCPCHGSRFDPTGKVIQGPAVKNLEKKKI